MQHSEFSEYLNVHRIFLHRHSFDRSHRFHDYLLITGTYRSNFSPPEMASYLCSVTGNRVFSAPTGPKRASRAKHDDTRVPRRIRSLLSLSLSLFVYFVVSSRLYQFHRFLPARPLPFSFARRRAISTPACSTPSPYFFPTFSTAIPSSPPPPPPLPSPTLIDLLNQQLRNFQHQKSWRTRKMNDRPRCSNDPSLK